MKFLTVMMIAALAAGCSKDKKPDTTPAPPTDTTSTPTTDQTSPPTDTAAAVPGEGQPCANKINLICPDGKLDACNKTPPSDKHMCVAK
jgi:hypothetical protein